MAIKGRPHRIQSLFLLRSARVGALPSTARTRSSSHRETLRMRSSTTVSTKPPEYLEVPVRVSERLCEQFYTDGTRPSDLA
jgi:hypothetical protein